MGLGDFSIESLEKEVKGMDGEATVHSETSKADVRHVAPEKEQPVYEKSTELKSAKMGSNDSVSSNDDVEPLRPRTKSKAKVGRKSASNSEFSQIRDFPRELILVAKREFPNATNNSDALAAYVYVKSGCTATVPDNIVELAKTWDGDKSAETIALRLTRLEEKSLRANQLLEELELLNSYLVFDRIGFRRDSPTGPRNIDFLETGVEDVITRIKEQAKQLRKKISIKEGRPIR